jgi:hypothetical protein
MNQDYKHPITSPLELSDEQVGEWLIDDGYPWDPSEQAVITITANRLKNVARQAFQAGADQELEACCEVLDNLNDGFWSEKLRAARRPKPPSLKEQALLAIDTAVADDRLSADVASVVRRALEQLPDNE